MTVIGHPLFRLLNRFTVSGIENIPLTGRVILASNHSSYLDPMLLFYISPRNFYAVTADFLFKIWWLGWGLRITDCIPAKNSVTGAIPKLNQDRMILIFPEGGCRSCRDVVIDRMHRGVAVFALKTGSPVIPIGIKGTFDCWPTSRILPRCFKKFDVRIGTPLALGRYDGDGTIPDEILREKLDLIAAAIKKLLE